MFKSQRCKHGRYKKQPRTRCYWLRHRRLRSPQYETPQCSGGSSKGRKVSRRLHSADVNLMWARRYINMDYLFFSTLRHSVLDTLNVSYDIACQWHKHLWHRMSAFPLPMQLSRAVKTVSFFVPKFHLPAHIEQCQTSFSFNFKVGVGRTDGEAPERGWANINPVASSTKEMGPGARRDTLDDYFGDSNWKKVVGLGESMFVNIIH